MISHDESTVIIFSSVHGFFTPDVKEAIMSGVAALIRFKIRVNRKRSLWWDEIISSLQHEHMVKYIPSLKEYNILFKCGDEVTRSSVSEFSEMQTAMVKLYDVAIMSFREMEIGEKYYLEMKAELELEMNPSSFIFVIDYLPFYNPIIKSDTDWVTSPLFYKSK